ncbi:hypothetical protein F8E02_02135 [Methanoculleus sp. Wushi-C6]|uniref:Uncharacterized protein n=1 Tax=Methanoculleus caldifontis TaxID=2651577 RepID=A0ABU3WYE8_9EURY|nr:hypothetical protein [Methanoculleus sp. Wushi-C6]MDV2480825.1 hypothetical protein [Methanoculleus sp. Wushi-C6]
MIGARNLALAICILVLCAIGTVSGSGPAPADAEPDGRVWIDGTPLIRAIHEDRGDLYRHIDSDTGGKEHVADTYMPGDARTFIATDFVTEEDYTVNATCRATGDYCYVFVDENETVAEGEIRDLVETFDRVIYPTVTGTFGTEIGVDRDRRIFILLFDIRDSLHDSATELSIAGYFDGSTSNKIDMIFLDADARGSEVRSTLAHELQHLVHHSRDPHEKTWVNEGCSGYAEFLCFSTENRAKVRAFNRHPDTPLAVADGRWARSEGEINQAHYGASLLWTLYLAENYGDRSGDAQRQGFLADLVAENRTGLAGVDATLALHGFNESSEDVFKRWVVANYLDAEGGKPPLGYDGIEITRYPEVTGRVDLTRGTGAVHSFPAAELPPWSAAYYEVKADDPAAVSFANDQGFWMERVVNRNGKAVIVVSPLADRGAFVLTVAEGNGTPAD